MKYRVYEVPGLGAGQSVGRGFTEDETMCIRVVLDDDVKGKHASAQWQINRSRDRGSVKFVEDET